MPDTTNYMIAGYGVIFALLILYSVSLWIRSAWVKKAQRQLGEGVKGEQPTKE
jgi:Na+-transporting methylmalonyl-CoA/oxaloacetate decarboxylase gamma subunit